MVRVCCTVYFELSTEELSNFLFFCDEQRTPSVKVSSESEQTTTTTVPTVPTVPTVLHCLLPAVGHCMNTHKHDSRSIIRYTDRTDSSAHDPKVYILHTSNSSPQYSIQLR